MIELNNGIKKELKNIRIVFNMVPAFDFPFSREEKGM